MYLKECTQNGKTFQSKTYISVERKCLFRSCMVYFTVGFVRNRSCLRKVLAFNSGRFDLACEPFSKLVVLFSSRGPANF